jgi:hypothetical protein
MVVPTKVLEPVELLEPTRFGSSGFRWFQSSSNR